MNFTKLSLFILGVIFFVFIASCSNNGQDLKQNQEEKIVGTTDKKLFLKIDGEIDEIYSFIPNTTNPVTNKTLTDDETRNNNIVLKEAIERVMREAVIDFDKKEIRIDVKNGKSLNMDERLFEYVMRIPIHRNRELFKNGYITFPATRSTGKDLILIKPGYFDENGELKEISDTPHTRLGEPHGDPSVFFKKGFSEIYDVLKNIADKSWTRYSGLEDIWDLSKKHANRYDKSEFKNSIEIRKYNWLDSEGYWGKYYGHANKFKYANTRDDRRGDKGFFYYLLYGKIDDVLVSVGTK